MTLPPFSLKRALLGRPMASAEERHERLSKKVALPVFSSDAISSTAYATEEILLILALAGTAFLHLALPIAGTVAFLLFVVALSYQQIVYAYPTGGGAYVVASENLGLVPGLVGGASLLVDYVLTVAVSVAAGVAAITSAFPPLYGHRVLLAVGLVVFVMLINLRGVRESGAIFAVPTYAFVVLCGGLVFVGIARWVTGTLPATSPPEVPATHALTVFLVLRAFSGGCAAMTGTEAISNGVQAFKHPESRNAAITLGIMAVILATLFIGITSLSNALHIVPREGDTVVSQVARVVYGSGGIFYYMLQIATMAILVLAANTSFAGFPRLSAILAEHGFLPRQFMNRGDRLVFSNGIIGLAVAAIVLLWIFGADTHALIPLYAVGVFIGFTLAQSGMVVHWMQLRDNVRSWLPRAFLNGLGALMTGIVAVVIVTSKFFEGAYLVVIAIPLIVLFFYFINRHYRQVAAVLEPATLAQMARLRSMATASLRTSVVLFVSQVNELTARSLSFANALSPDDVHAVTIGVDERQLPRLEERWAELGVDVPLEVVDSPYRELVRPALAYVRSLRPGPDHMVTVVIPEFVVEHWWEALFHNQNAFRLKGALLLVPWVVVLSVPFHLRERIQEAGMEAAGPDRLSPLG